MMERSLMPDKTASSGRYIQTVPVSVPADLGQATAARRIRASRRERRLVSSDAIRAATGISRQG
jgi:hypothetical protein